MDIIIKAVVIGVVGTVLTLLVKNTNPEFSTVMSLVVCCIILGLGLSLYSAVVEVLDLVVLGADFSAAYISPVLKCVGIGITARLGSELCKDSGQSAVAATVEICGAISAIYVSLPLIKTLLGLIGELV